MAVKPLTDSELVQFANFLLSLKRPTLTADYTNWRGEKATRYFEPMWVWFGATHWHPEPCLLLKAFDLERSGERDFKLSDFDMASMAQTEPTE